MSNSTTLIDQISSTQATKEVVVNANFDAASPAMIWGRRASTTNGLTWGYYGGTAADSAGGLHQIANGTLTLTASATNYVYATVGASSVAIGINTTGFPTGSIPLYSIVTGATSVTAYTDMRSYQPSAINALAMLSDVNVASPVDGEMLVYNAAQAKWLNTYQQDQGGFVDGNIDSWQMGTTFTLAAAQDTYTADMWVCNAGTGGAATVSQDVAMVGSEMSGMARPRKYRLLHSQTTAATTNPTVGQKLEGVGQYNGQTITISVCLQAVAALSSAVVGIRIIQNFGTGGSPSTAVVTTQAIAWNLGTTEQRFSAAIAVPSIAGKAVGTDGNDFLRIDLLLATGATYGIYHSQFQIDWCPSGTSATGIPLSFRYRGIQAESSRVFRYIYVTVGVGTLVGNALGTLWGTTGAHVKMRLPVRMRNSPALSLPSNSYTISGVGTTTGSVGTIRTSVDGVAWDVSSLTNAGTIGQPIWYNGNIIADARL
ncbi:hypothetical protein [Paraburkholderia caballeronis]|uniref:hypothetical protein n=1 Tax=Paraburkholderia caballeronis TaxID=416943 RepID=UPI0010649828|nr:hypothetical protein [Paraburkholderia caballeronis]TDV04696.1 hypothetical protein C7408_13158 [Paraburkholderia caballeronis]TDV07939.1 hypothetical protein C7406_13358 [Paraburkholderia caballeronis]TDV18230.1 hypothetical protein C7404_13158 [Paraburkholderia caballeronis]